jgi:prevent-host-death family protein
MDTIKATDFKARCLALMDEVARTRETIVVTKHGRPVAELRPYPIKRRATLIGLHRGQVKIRGDITSPLNVPWNADQED